MMEQNFIISQLMCDQLLKKSQKMLGQPRANVYHALEYRFGFSQMKKICSSGLELFLIQRLFEGKPYFRYLMSRRFCHRRAFFHLKNDSTGFCFLKMHHECGFESDITAFYFANIHHTFCLFNPPQFSNPLLVIGKIAWTFYFGRVFDNKVIDMNEALAIRLARYGHQRSDPLSSLVLAMTNSGMSNFLLSRFPDKKSIYYHIAWAQAYLKGFRIPANTNVMDSLRSEYWSLKNYQRNFNVLSWCLLPGETMWWSGGICLDAIWALSEMTKKGLPGKQRPDITMANRLIENFSQLFLSFPLSLRYREKEIEICGNYRFSAGKRQLQGM